MKKLILFVFWGFSVFLYPQNKPFLQDIPYYIENLSVFELGQEEGRTFYLPQEKQTLNGKWKFLWCDTPEGVPDNFFETNYNDKKWNSMDVPSNWEMQGYGDKLFRNVSTPFKANPPFVPKEYNPTGLYRRTFKVPANWDGKQIFLRLEKVASASFVWINGQQVGYNEGAQEPSEYNITKLLKKGDNTVAICVLKYSDGYYLEGQDYWRLAGIFDDVWLYAAPDIRLFDWQITTDFDNSYTDSDLRIEAKVKNYTNKNEDYKIKAKLYDQSNNKISEFYSEQFSIGNVNNTVSLDKKIANPLKWTSETPHLYTLELELITSQGKVQDKVKNVIGFKKTNIKDGVFYLNGVPLKVNAQNSHMQHPELGHTMNEETIRKDFEILKQFNFNAVRISHYPPVNKYLELANEYGLYIIDEVGNEAHATEWISDKPEYIEMYRDRCRKMVLRDRNYPCILFWSAGNESGEGPNITEVVKEGKSLDPTRYWMYGGNAFSHPAEDIIGPRYPTPMELEIQVGVGTDNDRRPSFMDEYLSVAGNGGGGLDDFWDVIYRHPRLMGGAIWDFVSPGVTEKIKEVQDLSPYNTMVNLMGNAHLVKEKGNAVLDLNGHDQWVEIYRSDNMEITSDALTLTCKVYPRKLISSCGSFITKGNYQFGLQQKGTESVEFYIYTDKKYSIYAPLPENWEYNWHQLTAVYDGKEMSIYIDGKKRASGEASGSIRNRPYPVNIGRNAEMHGQETSVYICDAQMDDVGIFDKAIASDFDAKEARLWLDFEKETDKGNFYSYGIGARTYGSIWPDRSVQPEMWQMKKTVQPISFNMLDSRNGVLEIWNRNHFINSSFYKTQWNLMEDGKIIQSGLLETNTAPLSKNTINVPYSKPSIVQGKEYRLVISSTLRKDEMWTSAGHEVAWDEFELPWKITLDNQINNSVKPICDLSDDKLIVSGNDFIYTFDKMNGLFTSLIYKGKQMLKSPLKLNLWRAPLANELDDWNASNAFSPNWKEGFGRSTATEMYSAGINDLTHQPLTFSVREIGNNIHVDIIDTDLMSKGEKEKKDLYIEGVQSNGILNKYEYIIDGNGTITIHHRLTPEGKMPLWFPRVGLTLTLNNSLNQVEWFGRGPQENYPDRKTGYKTGVYASKVDEMYEPYLIPQDYGLRTDIRWVKITDENGIGLQFGMDELFNFNAYPYSTDNLTKATYTYHLKKQDGVTLNLDYASTGVGCTARGVFDSYRAMPKQYSRTITVKPISSVNK